MKKFIFLLAAMAFPFVVLSQSKQARWSKEVLSIACNHIISHSEPALSDSIRYVFVAEDQNIVLSKFPGYSKLRFSTGSMKVEISLNEDNSSITEYSIVWGSGTLEITKFAKDIREVKSFLANFAEQKPAPAVCLLEGTDSLSLHYRSWYEKMRERDAHFRVSNCVNCDAFMNTGNRWKSGTDTHEFEVSWRQENPTADITVIYELSIYKRNPVESESESVFVFLDPYRPILSGFCSVDYGDFENITPEIIMKVFDTSNFWEIVD